jgi:hypothetical protein
METIVNFNSRNLLIGRFYFKKTENGNLLGEFSHNISLMNYSESADNDDYNEDFIGNYYTTWQENNEPHSAYLKIEFKPLTRNRIYILTWTSNCNEIFFRRRLSVRQNTYW